MSVITPVLSQIPPAAAIQAILSPTVRRTWRADIYDADGETLYVPDVPLTDGSVTVDGSRDEWRMCDVTFDNSDGLLVHGAGHFWYDKIIKFYQGYQWRTGAWECQVAECMIDKITEQYFPKTLEVTGRDYTKKLILSQVNADTNFPAGMLLEDVVSALAINAGVNSQRMTIPKTGLTLTADYLITGGTTRQKAITDLVSVYGYECFFDATGQYIMRLFQDPATAPQVWTYQTGPKVGNLVSWNKLSDDSNLFNHQVVVSTSSSADPPVWAEAINTSPGSPTNTDEVGDRVNRTTTAVATTYDQCLTLAQNYLAVSSLEDFEIDMQSIVFPWLEANDVVAFIDPDAGPQEPTMFLLSSFDLPFKLGPSSPIAKRVAIIS